MLECFAGAKPSLGKLSFQVLFQTRFSRMALLGDERVKIFFAVPFAFRLGLILVLPAVAAPFLAVCQRLLCEVVEEAVGSSGDTASHFVSVVGRRFFSTRQGNAKLAGKRDKGNRKNLGIAGLQRLSRPPIIRGQSIAGLRFLSASPVFLSLPSINRNQQLPLGKISPRFFRPPRLFLLFRSSALLKGGEKVFPVCLQRGNERVYQLTKVEEQ